MESGTYTLIVGGTTDVIGDFPGEKDAGRIPREIAVFRRDVIAVDIVVVPGLGHVERSGSTFRFTSTEG